MNITRLLERATLGTVLRRSQSLSLSPLISVFLGVLVLAAFTLDAEARSAQVNKIRLWKAPDHTRVVFDLSAPAEHKVFSLTHPDRLVVDIPGAALTASTELNLHKTPIEGIRSAEHGGKLRVVLELREAVAPRSFVLKPNDQYGHRLVVDLYDSATRTERGVSDVLGARRDVVIAIDAGHGGEDPGAIGPKRLQEKHVVLAISKALQRRIDAEPGFSALMVRDGDYYVGLRKRTQIARDQRADAFISIHADAFTSSAAHGASVYALSTNSATSETAKYLARRENRADLIGGVGTVSLSDKDKMLAGVLLDLSMTATLESSLALGDEVLRKIGGIARLHKKRVEQAGFMVLKSPDVPSILVETGFISNPGEAARLARPAYQKAMAKAIFAGLKNHFEQRPPEGTLLAERRAKGGRVHVIARGDTLSDIALRYQISVRDLKRHNRLSSSQIKIGQRLKIPVSS